jgi:metacaspase-1
MSETWVCFDRMIVDKELYALWSNFARNVHIEVYSDSCHSGTVVRERIIPDSTKEPPSRGAMASAKQVYAKASNAAGAAIEACPTLHRPFASGSRARQRRATSA